MLSPSLPSPSLSLSPSLPLSLTLYPSFVPSHSHSFPPSHSHSPPPSPSRPSLPPPSLPSLPISFPPLFLSPYLPLSLSPYLPLSPPLPFSSFQKLEQLGFVLVATSLGTSSFCQSLEVECENGGVCMDDSEDQFVCDCTDMYTGLYCQLRIDFCMNDPCGPGMCMNKVNHIIYCG